MAESKSPSPLGRAAFWTAYILGTLVLLFSFLLAQVPRGRNTDFTLDYICWSLAGSLLLASLVAAKHAWNIWNPLKWHGVSSPAQLFIGAAWVELAFSVYGILSFVATR
jgi:hypothetical protein